MHLKAKQLYTSANDVRKKRKPRAAPRKSRAAPRKSRAAPRKPRAAQRKSRNEDRRMELAEELAYNQGVVDSINELITADNENEREGHDRYHGTQRGDDVRSYLYNAPLSELEDLAESYKEDSDDDDIED